MCAESEKSHIERDTSSQGFRGSRVSRPGSGTVLKGNWREVPFEMALAEMERKHGYHVSATQRPSTLPLMILVNSSYCFVSANYLTTQQL